MKRDGEFICTCLPFALLSEQTMGEFAERAMSHAKTSADPIRHLTDQGGVSVVDPNEFGDVRAHP